MTSQFLHQYYSQLCHIVHRYYPGVILAGILALAAQFISDYYGAPTMLMALLFGMALNFLSKEKRCVAGINFTAKKVLRIGICLLGARISFDMISAIGLVNVAITFMAVLATIVFGIAVSKWFNIELLFVVPPQLWQLLQYRQKIKSVTKSLYLRLLALPSCQHLR